jgi:hypothetical protein
MQISNIWDVWYCGSPRSLAKKRRLLAVKYTQEATERRGNPFSYKRALVSQNHRKQIEPVPGWAAMAPRPTPCPPSSRFPLFTVCPGPPHRRTLGSRHGYARPRIVSASPAGRGSATANQLNSTRPISHAGRNDDAKLPPTSSARRAAPVAGLAVGSRRDHCHCRRP